ncbi:MAG: sensor domain-containing diguanylate cyclase [Treponema sp.]|nr:sensor domain-containing diguanylate cyclase [Treponema sp.]
MIETKEKTKHTRRKTKKNRAQEILEVTLQYEKKIYDLEQLLDIAKSFCSTLDFSNLLESIVYICMAQMHVLGAEIFVRDFISNEGFILETSREIQDENAKIIIPDDSPVISKLLELNKPVTYSELCLSVGTCEDLSVLGKFSPTLIVPLIQRNHLNGVLVLQERIAIDDDTSYTEYEQEQIMSIATLASVAINNARLLEMSSTDMMTHLKLKYYFFSVLSEVLDNAIQMQKSAAVLMFDIDFFKHFNDTYGHECGDYVLITVADLIKKSLRETDVASRYGGEEFTVLLNEAKEEEAMLVAERIRSAIANHDFVYNDQHMHVTISGGVSVFDKDSNPVTAPNLFVDQADQALYISKSSGRNKVSLYAPFLESLDSED